MITVLVECGNTRGLYLLHREASHPERSGVRTYRVVAQVCGARRVKGPCPARACRRQVKPIVARPHLRQLTETEGQVLGQLAGDGHLQRHAGAVPVEGATRPARG